MPAPVTALSSSRRTRAAALVAAASLALVSCSEDDAAAPTPTPTETVAETPSETMVKTTSVVETSEVKTSVMETSEAETSEVKTTESSISTSPTAEDKEVEALKKVREEFASIAPPEFFDRLDGCVPAGIEGSYDCSGSEVGQFQFFASEAKAASTTQLLTELRSSKIVEDNGQRVVGWSTVGTSAIITVVDNAAGLVMQQLISSDQEDPRQRIYDLGLAKAN